jgi:hypothetical protein
MKTLKFKYQKCELSTQWIWFVSRNPHKTNESLSPLRVLYKYKITPHMGAMFLCLRPNIMTWPLFKIGHMRLTKIVGRLQFSTTSILNKVCFTCDKARFCGLVVRVPGYRSRGPGFDSRRYQIFFLEAVGLKRVPLSLVRKTEELLERKSSGSGCRKPRLTAMGIRCADHVTQSIGKSWH